MQRSLMVYHEISRLALALGNCIQRVVGSNSKHTNYLMNQLRNPECTINGKSQTKVKDDGEDTRLKTTTAKFKCTREHVLGHDWLIKIT